MMKWTRKCKTTIHLIQYDARALSDEKWPSMPNWIPFHHGAYVNLICASNSPEPTHEITTFVLSRKKNWFELTPSPFFGSPFSICVRSQQTGTRKERAGLVSIGQQRERLREREKPAVTLYNSYRDCAHYVMRNVRVVTRAEPHPGDTPLIVLYGSMLHRRFKKKHESCIKPVALLEQLYIDWSNSF